MKSKKIIKTVKKTNNKNLSAPGDFFKKNQRFHSNLPKKS